MQKDYTTPWKKMANSWKLFTPPWRPSDKNIVIFKKLLDKTIDGIKSPKVLILGATPEIRDMLADYKNVEVTLADITMEMILAMNELVKKENFSKEIWVKSDWLKMSLEKNYFDFIIGDYIISQLPKNALRKFLPKIKSLLKPNGRFVIRAVYFNPDTALTFNEIIKKFNKIKKSNQSASDIASYCFVGKDILKNRDQYIFSLPKLKLVTKNFERKNGKNKWLPILNRIFAPYKKEWFFYDLTHTENNLKKYFVIDEKAEEPDGSSLKNTTFIYCLKPK